MYVPIQIKMVWSRLRQTFPWYGQLAAAKQDAWLPAGSLQENTEEQAAELPLVTASVLENYYYTDNNPLAEKPELNCYRTSGTSSGRRKTIYYSDSDEEAYLRIKHDVFRELVGGYGYRTAMSDMGTGHAEATAVAVFRSLGMEVRSLSFRLPIEQHIEQLASFRPEVLYTMPSIMDRILHASADPRSYGIRHVVLVGEIASPSWILRTAERLGIGADRITDTYGSIEIGTIAYFSHEHGRYLLTEGLYAEGIAAEELGDDLDPLPESEQVLVLTSAVRECFPALRYVTYDVVRDLRPIEVNGVLRPSFQSIVKRIGPDLKHGEKISLYDIEQVVYKHVRNVSIRVKVSGNELIVYVLRTDTEPDEQSLAGIQQDIENRIPEIGVMIASGILNGIQVCSGIFQEEQAEGAVKHKKIVYE